MKPVECDRTSGIPTVLSLFVIPFLAGQVMAQGYRGPLTVEGLNQQNNHHSARAGAFGGVTIGSQGDAAMMFRNPTSLQSVSGIQLSVGGMRQFRDRIQEQHFAPVRYYPNLSLLLEGLTSRVPDPDPDLFGFTPADTVQRPFDDIEPHWSESNTTDLPLHALVAVPIALGDLTVTAGIGAVQYANLNHYYQNNNVLDPAVLSQRPLPTLRPTDDNPLTAGWYQSIRSRDGTMYGYGLALAGHLQRYNLTVGVSGMLLDGSSNDFEQLLKRGSLTFYSNAFRADSSYGILTRTGKSEFSGSEFSIGSTLHGRYVSVGFVARPPTEFTRRYATEIRGDTSGVSLNEAVNNEDQFQLPWRGSIGLLLTPRENLSVGIEYEFRPYGSATFTSSGDNETSPWESSSLVRIGVQYEVSPWLALRGGIRGEADVFVPDGSPIAGDPVVYRVYSAGFGLNFSGVQWNVAYERAEMTYQDLWGSAISSNSDTRHVLLMDISYTLALGR